MIRTTNVALLSLLILVSGCHTPKTRSPAPESAPAPATNAASEETSIDTNALTAEKMADSGTNVLPAASADPVLSIAPQLTPGLVVAVSVLVSGNKEIDETAKRISNAGEISLPLIGNVQANGMSLDELTTRLTTLYSQYFVQPQVVIEFVKDQNSDMVSPWGYITVLGRVKSPGRVSIPPTQDMTVSGAIQKAGGLDTSAKDSAIKVTRQNPNGRSAQYEVDLRSVGSRGRVHDDLILKPGDVIFVPEMIF
jgi:protein involved in polysaccharide export with SLBB domain